MNQIRLIPFRDPCKNILRVLLTFLVGSVVGLAAAESVDSPALYISPPWEISESVTESGISDTKFPFSRYTPEAQSSLIQAFRNEGAQAMPDLFCSGVQFVDNVGSEDRIDVLLKTELRDSGRVPVIIPVIDRPVMRVFSAFRENLFKVTVPISLYVLSEENGLGEKLASETLKSSIVIDRLHPEKTQESIDDCLRELDEQVRDKFDIDKILKKLSPTPPERAQPKIDTTDVPSDIVRIYFGQSEIVSYAGWEKSRIEKDNFYCHGERVEDVSDLTFSFDAAKEYPLLMFAWILLPDGTVRRVGAENMHVEQPPGAIPGRIYTTNRILVLNLPGLVPRATVTYCIQFTSAAEAVTADSGSSADHYPLGRDFYIDRGDTSYSWQVRVITDSRSDIYLDTRGHFDYQREDLRGGSGSHVIAHGRILPLLKGITEPLTDYEPSVLRASTEPDVAGLYRHVRDSVYRRAMPPQPPPSAVAASLRSKQDADETNSPEVVIAAEEKARHILDILSFIGDSLRYTSTMLRTHRVIPITPKELLDIRVGDCKDFSAFLIHELMRKGIHAVPALVNSSDPEAFFGGPTSHSAADHMIVHLPHEGWWIDPTAVPVVPTVPPPALEGNGAVILSPAGITRERIPLLSEKDIHGYVTYAVQPEGRNLKVRYSKKYSPVGSAYTRELLRKTERDKWTETLYHGSKSSERFDISEDTLEVRGLDRPMSPLEINREFTAFGAVTTTGEKKILHLPYLPLSDYVSLFTMSDRKSPLKLPHAMVRSYRIILPNSSGLWPELPAPVTDSLVGLSTERVSPDTVVVHCRLAKGTYVLNRYALAGRMIRSVRLFFSTGILLD